MSLTDEQLAEIRERVDRYDVMTDADIIFDEPKYYRGYAVRAHNLAGDVPVLLAEVERLTAQRDKVLDNCDQVERLITALGHETSGKGLIPQIRAIYAGPHVAPTNSQMWEHPERHCHRCGGPNIPWSAPSPLWNEVMRGGNINGDEPYNGIVCPTCFAILAEQEGIADLWRFDAQRIHRTLQTVTPSGRVWNEQTWMWEPGLAASDPEPCERCGGTGAVPELTLGGKHSGKISETACPRCSQTSAPPGTETSAKG